MKKLAIFLLIVPLVIVLSVRLAAVLAGATSIVAFADAAGPLAVVAVIGAGLALASYILGLVTNDYSWVDRMWSTVPVLYAWVYAAASNYDHRVTIVALLISVWGARLTFNFARRGGYTGMEDYRWELLRTRIRRPILWQAFSLLFISVYQNLLFVLFTLPVYVLYQARGGSTGPAFWAAAVAFVLFLLYETTADQQQWNFQLAKERETGHGEYPAHYDDIRRGFRTTGLFRLSRHPNYFGEIMIWWSVYSIGTTAISQVFHWSGLGALLLTLLFLGSTRFTEAISSSKYPAYQEYRAATSAIVPWPSRAGQEDRPEERADT
jgi:steroid 5-alpha reductase family enzyme